MTLFLQFFLTGIVTGSFLILATIGFSFTRRVEGFLNIAHAELLGVSAFTTWGLNALLGWHVVAAAIAGIVSSYLVKFNTGHHGSILTPAQDEGESSTAAGSAAANAEMQLQVATYLASRGRLLMVQNTEDYF